MIFQVLVFKKKKKWDACELVVSLAVKKNLKKNFALVVYKRKCQYAFLTHFLSFWSMKVYPVDAHMFDHWKYVDDKKGHQSGDCLHVHSQSSKWENHCLSPHHPCLLNQFTLVIHCYFNCHKSKIIFLGREGSLSLVAGLLSREK